MSKKKDSRSMLYIFIATRSLLACMKVQKLVGVILRTIAEHVSSICMSNLHCRSVIYNLAQASHTPLRGCTW